MPQQLQTPFNDFTFKVSLDQESVNERGQKYVLRRIYEIYDKEFSFLEE